jgi:mannose/fructose/N-acetylgalactosamine-specific phosphotransferase system component IIC
LNLAQPVNQFGIVQDLLTKLGFARFLRRALTPKIALYFYIGRCLVGAIGYLPLSMLSMSLLFCFLAQDIP